MIRILFVCHGNICRSPMAESVCAYLVSKRSLQGRIEVSSAAAREDELGSPPHRGTREKLAREGIPLVPHRARLLTREDGERFDYIIGMDSHNLRDMKRILGEAPGAKLCLLLDFTSSPRPIADPWYSGNFDETFDDILLGCNALLDALACEIL